MYVLIPVLAVSLAMAQEADTQNEQKPAAGDTKEQKTTEPAKAAANDKKPTPDTFTPSEEISEDLSVSFPVDI